MIIAAYPRQTKTPSNTAGFADIGISSAPSSYSLHLETTWPWSISWQKHVPSLTKSKSAVTSWPFSDVFGPSVQNIEMQGRPDIRLHFALNGMKWLPSSMVKTLGISALFRERPCQFAGCVQVALRAKTLALLHTKSSLITFENP